MYQRDATKARIKKLEGDMFGLVSRLKRLSAQPDLFSTASQAFNTRSARAALHKSFHSAGRVEEALKLQILCISNELSALASYKLQEAEFRMAA